MQLDDDYGDVAQLRMLRMMMKEKLMTIADSRQAMERYYSEKYQKYKEQYKIERAKR